MSISAICSPFSVHRFLFTAFCILFSVFYCLLSVSCFPFSVSYFRSTAACLTASSAFSHSGVLTILLFFLYSVFRSFFFFFFFKLCFSKFCLLNPVSCLLLYNPVCILRTLLWFLYSIFRIPHFVSPVVYFSWHLTVLLTASPCTLRRAHVALYRGLRGSLCLLYSRTGWGRFSLTITLVTCPSAPLRPSYGFLTLDFGNPNPNFSNNPNTNP